MLYPWVQLLKWEGIAPFGPHLAADHAQSMRANTFVPVPHVLFVVESSRPERGWTRFVLRDPTGTVPAGTRDSDVAAKLVVGAAVKLTNVHSPPFMRCSGAALSGWVGAGAAGARLSLLWPPGDRDCLGEPGPSGRA
jgi:hypothetical protein